MNTQTYATEFDDPNDSFLSTRNERVNVGVASCCHGGGKTDLVFFGRHLKYYNVDGR